jgi:hypothetical protein
MIDRSESHLIARERRNRDSVGHRPSDRPARVDKLRHRKTPPPR